MKTTDLERRAIEAAKQHDQTVPDTWRPYIFEAVANGCLVTGCDTTTYKRGPRKGQTKYLTDKNWMQIILPQTG